MPQNAEPYLLIAQQDWDLNLGSNARNMAVELSLHHTVVYINPALDVKTMLTSLASRSARKRLQLALGLGQNTRQVANNLWVHTPSAISVSINWLRVHWLYNIICSMNGWLFFNSVKKMLRQLALKPQQVIVLNDSQMFTGLFVKRYLGPMLSFYYIRDNLVEHPYFARHGARLEPKAIAMADAVFANSLYLKQYAEQYNANAHDIGQGCEFDLYDTTLNYEVPADLANIPYPRIGYTGFLTGERLDIALLEALAQQRPGWQFVLVGPEEIMFQQSRLHQMPNVHFLGARRSDALPAYLHHFDVCINPQLLNALTVGNYPRKIDEYLAMGKPTVATLTPAMQMFAQYVHLVSGVEGYVQAIEKALQPQSAQQQHEAIAFARSHTWQSCINRIKSIQKNQTSCSKHLQQSHLKKPPTRPFITPASTLPKRC